jgi:protein-disulfide isomerase
MPERIRPSKRPMPKRHQNRAQGPGIPSRYVPIIAFGSVLVVVAVIIGVLVFAPSSKTEPQDKSIGPADAKVVITEYGDFQCPACKGFALEIEPKLKADFVDKGLARLAFRQMSFIGEESHLAAQASECANEQGQFWAYYAKVYEHQDGENVGTYTKDSLTSYAKEIKLDEAKFTACLNSGRYAAKVQRETQEGADKGVNSTPSVLINDKLAEWNGDYAQLSALIQKAIDAAK